MGPPGHRHAPPPLAPTHPRVPWQPIRPTEEVHSSQRSLSAPFPAAPSRRGCPRSLAADDNPRLIPPASLPHDRGCPRFIADDFLLRLPWRRSGCLRLYVADDFPLRPPRRRSGCLWLGVADDFPLRPPRRRSGCLRYASRMISRSALLGVEADACGYASRMISRSALLGVEADACANPQMISRTPFRAAEGALANLILILSPFRHSGLRAGIHPFNSSLSSSRDDRPVALGVGAPNGAPTPLSPYTKGPA